MKTSVICLLGAVLLLSPALSQAQFTFTTNNGTITITQFADDGFAGDVIIPDSTNNLKITAIGPEAFFQCDSVTSVTMGTNLTTIGQDAFFQCTELTTATIPGSVTNIGLGPFWDCQALTQISLSSSNAFYGVTNGALCNKTFTSIIQYPCGLSGSYTISANVTNFEDAFIGNTLTSIQVNSGNPYFTSTNGVLCTKPPFILIDYPGGAPGSYTVPGVVTNIFSGAFEYGPGVTNVIIGTNVLGIGGFAFYDCQGLTAILVNPTNTYFSSSNGVLFDKHQTTLLQYPSGLPGTYTVPGTVTNMAAGAFGDAFGLTSVVIPDSVTSIPDQTFYSCQNLVSASIGDQVSSIGQQAFNECFSLTSVTIPGSVTNIAEYAFLGCTKLESVTFGSGVQSIGFEAFSSCYDLTNACFEGKEPVDGGSIFAYDDSLSTILYVNGTSGWGPEYDGLLTTPCTTCGGVEPQLTIARSGADVILTWSSDFTGFTLQSATNLTSSATWSNVSPAPVVISGLNTVTNAISGLRKFYRLNP